MKLFNLASALMCVGLETFSLSIRTFGPMDVIILFFIMLNLIIGFQKGEKDNGDRAIINCYWLQKVD